MLKHLKIGKKLILSFIIVAIIASIAGIVSSAMIKSIDSQYSYVLSNYGFAQGDIGKAMLVLSDSRRCTRDIVTYTDAANIASAKEQLAEVAKKYDIYAADVLKSTDSVDGKKLYAEIETGMVKYREVRDKVIQLGDTTDEAQSRAAAR